MVQWKEWNLLGDLRAARPVRYRVLPQRADLFRSADEDAGAGGDRAGRWPPDGMLYLGGAETVLGLTTRFAPLPAERGVYGLVGGKFTTDTQRSKSVA